MLIGAAAGTGAALLTTPLIARLLFGIAPYDVLTFLGVPTLIVGVGAIACWLPASVAVRGAITNALRMD